MTNALTNVIATRKRFAARLTAIKGRVRTRTKLLGPTTSASFRGLLVARQTGAVVTRKFASMFRTVQSLPTKFAATPLPIAATQ